MRSNINELVGTFFIVLTASLTANPLAVGFMLCAMTYMGFQISGAHYNPAVTFAVFIRQGIKGDTALSYMTMQVTGGLLAGLLYYLLKGSTFAPQPSLESTNMSAMLIELLFTTILILTYLQVCTARKAMGNQYYGLAMGFVYGAAYAAGVSISGGVFNPAYAIGTIVPDFLLGGQNLGNLGIYIVGPFVGSLLSIIIFKSINPEME